MKAIIQHSHYSSLLLISNSFLCKVHLFVVCMICTSLYSRKLLYLFSFCSFSYSLPKEIGNFVRRKDPNKMQHRNTIIFRIY